MSSFEQTVNGRNAMPEAQQIPMDMLFDPVMSFSLKFRTFMLYITPISKGQRIRTTAYGLCIV